MRTLLRRGPLPPNTAATHRPPYTNKRPAAPPLVFISFWVPLISDTLRRPIHPKKNNNNSIIVTIIIPYTYCVRRTPSCRSSDLLQTTPLPYTALCRPTPQTFRTVDKRRRQYSIFRRRIFLVFDFLSHQWSVFTKNNKIKTGQNRRYF